VKDRTTKACRVEEEGEREKDKKGAEVERWIREGERAGGEREQES